MGLLKFSTPFFCFLLTVLVDLVKNTLNKKKKQKQNSTLKMQSAKS